jgi:predicted nucleic acid-binding protein
VRVCPNTSPLLVLARIERLDLLGDPSSLVLTRSVLDEVRDKLDAATQRVNDLAARATLVDPLPSERVDLVRSLGPGEKSVLAWALSAAGNALCVFDDAAARVAARRLGLSVTGTLGLVLRAKLEGALGEAAPVLEQAVAAGLYLDDAVLGTALAAVGESWRR